LSKIVGIGFIVAERTAIYNIYGGVRASKYVYEIIDICSDTVYYPDIGGKTGQTS
jgi:hypothetical protein